MNKKLLFVLSLILCMTMILCACETNSPVSTEEIDIETPTPEPTPGPEYIVFVGQPEYFENTQKYFSEEAGYNVETYENIDQVDESLNIVGLVAVTDEITSKLSAIAENAKTVVCTKQDISPNGFSVIRLTDDGDNTGEKFLNAAIEYPYHDTPVRFIAMFENADKLAAVYDSYYAEGMIFPKERYAPGETPASEWLTGKLAKYVEGAIDAIVCETPELAITACDILLGLNWSNTEVFCSSDSDELKVYAQKYPKLMAIRVGLDIGAADDAISTELKGLFDGKSNETVSISSGVIISE